MASLPGRCTNEMFCTLGASGRLVQVPDDSAFVCPMCGKPLVPPSTPRRDRLRRATLFSFGVLLAAASAFIGGMVIASLGFWPAPPRVTVLASRPILRGVGQRHVAALQAPKPLVVTVPSRRRVPADGAAPSP